MTLFINNDMVAEVLTMKDTIEVLEKAYADLVAKEAVCRPRTIIFGLVDDVGFYADGEISAYRAAFHGSPLIGLVGIRGGDLDIDTRPAHRLFGDQIGVGFFQHLDGVPHGEHFAHHVVVDE